MSLQLPSLARLSNDELFGLANQVKRDLSETFNAVPDFSSAFLAAMNDFHSAMDQPAVEGYSKNLKDADAEADTAWSGMRAHLKANLNHPIAAVREATEVVFTAFDVNNRPTQRSYDVEYGMLERLLHRLSALDAEIVRTSESTAWIDALRERINAFLTLYNKRNQMPTREVGAIRTARVKLMDEIRNLVENVNALNRLTPSDELSTFTEGLSKYFDLLRVRLKSRRTKAQNAIERTSGGEDTSDDGDPDHNNG